MTLCGKKDKWDGGSFPGGSKGPRDQQMDLHTRGPWDSTKDNRAFLTKSIHDEIGIRIESWPHVGKSNEDLGCL